MMDLLQMWERDKWTKTVIRAEGGDEKIVYLFGGEQGISVCMLFERHRVKDGVSSRKSSVGGGQGNKVKSPPIRKPP